MAVLVFLDFCLYLRPLRLLFELEPRLELLELLEELLLAPLLRVLLLELLARLEVLELVPLERLLLFELLARLLPLLLVPLLGRLVFPLGRL